MSVHNDGANVLTGDAIITWDGIKTPDVSKINGSISHNLTVAIIENSVEKVEVEQLLTNVLATSEFKGVLPNGGKWPLKPLDLSKFGDSAPLLQGRVALTVRTRNGVPPVYDMNGNRLNPMQFNQLIYPGAIVRVLMHGYSFNTDGNRGIGGGLDGIMIVDGTAPKLDVSGGLSETAVGAVMAGRSVPGMVTPAPVAAPPVAVAPHPGFVTGAAAAPVPPTPAVPAPVPPVPAAPAGPVMTALAAGAPYEAFIAQGWTDDALRAAGYIQ